MVKIRHHGRLIWIIVDVHGGYEARDLALYVLFHVGNESLINYFVIFFSQGITESPVCDETIPPAWSNKQSSFPIKP
ncbi:hypothetical protein OIU84_006750 [Salix udensis]|uniref:Uncharacterized protein n=1 Tax=Salix udensis TaxID=889485 RepID=A0AAD6K110_9ROSI|nr:hypothetical protein OIU84_006750 [Salix udensis]